MTEKNLHILFLNHLKIHGGSDVAIVTQLVTEAGCQERFSSYVLWYLSLRISDMSMYLLVL